MSTGDFILSYRLVLSLSLVGFIQLSLFCKCKKLMPKLNYMLNGECVYWWLYPLLNLKSHYYFFFWVISVTYAFHCCIPIFCCLLLLLLNENMVQKPQKASENKILCSLWNPQSFCVNLILNILEVGEELFRWFTSINVKADKWGIERENEDMSDSWNRAPGLGNGPKWMGELQERLGDKA